MCLCTLCLECSHCLSGLLCCSRTSVKTLTINFWYPNKFFNFISDLHEKQFRSKYIILFVVVIVGSVVLTTVMTLAEVIQKRRRTKNDLASKKSTTMSSIAHSKSNSHTSLEHARHRLLNSPYRDQSSSAPPDSGSGTFTSSRLNENVSFRYLGICRCEQAYVDTLCRLHCLVFII